MTLVSIAADGVGYNSKIICDELISFLKGESNHVRLVDTNHNAKIFCDMIVGGSRVVIARYYFIDPQLLVQACVHNELWRVKD